MESLILEEEIIIKDIRNLFRLKKEQNYTASKGKGNLFRQEKETKAIKNRTFRDIKNLFVYEKIEENYYKPAWVSNFWSNHYIKYKSNSDIKNKTLSVEEYVNKISPYSKEMKMHYAYLKFMMGKIDACKNNPENSSTTTVNEHIPSGFSISRILPFTSIENKHDVYRDKDCMKKFCEFLREHPLKII